MADLSMIVRMVIYKCRELNNPVTETLAAYVAQTTLNGRKLSKKHKTWPFFSFPTVLKMTVLLFYTIRNRKILSRKLDLRGRGQRIGGPNYYAPPASRSAQLE